MIARAWAAAAAFLLVSCGGKTEFDSIPGAGGTLGSGGKAGGTSTGGAGARVDASPGLGGSTGGAGFGDSGNQSGGGGGSAVDASPPPVWPDVVQNAACSIAPSAPAPLKWIDDFEGGSNYMPDLAWDEFDDGAEVITKGSRSPTPERVDLIAGSYDGVSQYGMHFQGYMPLPGSTTTFGATFAVETEPAWNAPGTRLSVDFGAYKGIVFWARVAAASGVKGNATFAIPTIDTDPGGGLCSENAVDGGGASSCYAHFAKEIRITRVCWMPFIIAFADLRQTWGVPTPAGFDAAHVYGVQLNVSAYKSAPDAGWKVDYSKTNWPLDVFIDDMYLY